MGEKGTTEPLTSKEGRKDEDTPMPDVQPANAPVNLKRKNEVSNEGSSNKKTRVTVRMDRSPQKKHSESASATANAGGRLTKDLIPGTPTTLTGVPPLPQVHGPSMDKMRGAVPPSVSSPSHPAGCPASTPQTVASEHNVSSSSVDLLETEDGGMGGCFRWRCGLLPWRGSMCCSWR